MRVVSDIFILLNIFALNETQSETIRQNIKENFSSPERKMCVCDHLMVDGSVLYCMDLVPVRG
jgi:hypothetical protein